MAPKPEPPLIGAVDDKKAVGGRHKQPGRLSFVSWATNAELPHVCGFAVAPTNKSLARMNKSLLVLSKKCTPRVIDDGFKQDR